MRMALDTVTEVKGAGKLYPVVQGLESANGQLVFP